MRSPPVYFFPMICYNISIYYVKGGESMNDRELISNLIDSLTNLLRIQKAEDKDAEIENQIDIIKAKLKSFGVMVDEIKLR